MNILIGITIIIIIIFSMAVLFGMIYFIFKGIEKTIKSDNFEFEAQNEAEHQPPLPEDGKWKIVNSTVHIK